MLQLGVSRPLLLRSRGWREVSALAQPHATPRLEVRRFELVGVLVFVLLVLGCSAQTCSANARSRCSSKFRIISSKDSPAGAPEALKTQAHSEHPKPRKRCCSIHTSLRLMAAPRRGLTPRLLLASDVRMRGEM